MLLGILAVGAVFDVSRRRIPNWLILCGLAVGVWLELVNGGPFALLLFLVRFLTVTAAWFPIYSCRMIGAGDVKLMSLIAGYLGFGRGALVIFTGLLAAASLSLYRLIHRDILKKRLLFFIAYVRHICQTREMMAYYDPGRDGDEVILPLAPCLCLGMLISMALP